MSMESKSTVVIDPAQIISARLMHFVSRVAMRRMLRQRRLNFQTATASMCLKTRAITTEDTDDLTFAFRKKYAQIFRK